MTPSSKSAKNRADFPVSYDLRRSYFAGPKETHMDRITQSLLGRFSEENKLNDLQESSRFEHFCTFLTLKRHHSKSFDTNNFVAGAGADTGIDAVAIIVNGALVVDIDMIDEILELNGYLEVSFIFIQAERSPSFDGSKIGNIGFGVMDFFRDSPQLPRNDRIAEAAAICAKIYDASPSFRKPPACWIYYATTGRWLNDTVLVARKDAVIADLRTTSMFGAIEFFCYGAEDLHRLHAQTKNAVSRSFLFEKKVEVPVIEGVNVAFVGYIPATTFVDIIKDDAGDDILGSIFYDNVRDWQDYNPVNSEMRATLDSNAKSRFVLMNNGVTIIAKGFKQSGSNFTIEDFQIVNGCQTSHVVFHQRTHIDASVAVPIRLIWTTDDEVIESIVLATNRQTELKPEQLYALTSFSKRLEQYFLTFPEEKRVYYERRDGQYDKLPIERKRIISPQSEIKSFSAMFLAEPHASTKSYKALRERVGKNIFAKDDRLEPYFVAAFAAYELERQYGSTLSHKLPAIYKSARYHILLALRLLLDPRPLSPMGSKEMGKRCEAMMEKLWNAAEVDSLFQQARVVIDEVSGGDLSRDKVRTQNITDLIISQLGDHDKR